MEATGIVSSIVSLMERLEITGRPSVGYSFGDKGVTATVSASGRLQHVSRHFAGQDFGYCVDHPSTPEPYFIVDRFESLLSLPFDFGRTRGIDPTFGTFSIADELATEFVHDRWPRFLIKTVSGFQIEMQFFASGGVIYQTYEFIFQETGNPPPLLTMTPDLLIRQLEFIDKENTFNEAGPMDEAYETELLENRTCIKRSHRIDGGEVALFVSACSNGELLTFQEAEGEESESESEGDSSEQEQEGDSDTQSDGDGTQGQQAGKSRPKKLGIVWSNKVLDHIRNDKSLKVTFAYHLDFLDRTARANPTINAENIETASQRIKDDLFEEHLFTKDTMVNRALRRNLEHILSVCSIPVIAGNDKSQEPAIALTCGDVDGHRVATAASFYCFEFLLLALEYFKSSPHQSDYTRWMTERILKTCTGHLKWLFGKDYRNLAKTLFVPHCWVNGKVIDEWDKDPFLPPRSLVEVPFQIIKAGDFYARHKEWFNPKETEAVVDAWIEELDQRNKLGCYAFPRYSNEPTHNFYLTDHVFIWRAIKCAESLGFESKLSRSILREGNESDARPAKKSTKTRNYSSIQVQNQILKRFATENPISKKRMIAVSRSPAHNQFLLRSKDSGLFQAMDLGLFDKPGAEKGDSVWQNKVDTWRNLVDCQAHHDDNDDTTWDEPLRFALSFIMAQTGKRMNQRSVDEMRSRAVSVLLQSAWPNGLLPGRFDANQEPILYGNAIMQDTYWANSFEMPYILWKYSQRPSTDNNDLKAPTKDGSMVTEPKSVSSSDAELLASLKKLLQGQIGTNSLPDQTAQAMKRTFPINNVVDQKNIVELSDEWLYNEPDFFAHGATSDEVSQFSSFFPKMIKNSPKGIAVVDVPKSKMSKTNERTLDSLIQVFESPTKLRDFMCKKRLPRKAKKRFCASFATCPDSNQVHIQTASEIPALEAFYKRHCSNDKFIEDVTEPELNKWTTELHLSFYSIDRQQSTWTSAMAQADPFSLKILNEDWSPKGLVKIAMSFRFDGDFFDRYWTCHFLKCDPQISREFDIGRTLHDLLTKSPAGSNDRKQPWKQRRVLELLLFDRILLQMQTCAAEILQLARRNALGRPAWNNTDAQDYASVTEGHPKDSSNVDPDDFLTTSSRFQQCQQMLQRVEQDLHENLDKVERWLDREKDREAGRPRWTFNDESRYRVVISKLLVSNQHRIQELTRGHASISNFNILLTKRLEAIRSDLDQRRADDIKRFTYVTVVFLPLGFATGVFSMSQAPAGKTTVSMAITAIVALAATILLLKLAEPLEELYKRISVGFHSLLAKMRGGREKRRRDTDDPEAARNTHTTAIKHEIRALSLAEANKIFYRSIMGAHDR